MMNATDTMLTLMILVAASAILFGSFWHDTE
jgi:hypothetical protein